jgi:hypothetical protein
MQTENFDAGRSLALEALSAEAVLKQMAGQDASVQVVAYEEFAPRRTAMRGLAAAIPLALLLWTVIGVLLCVLAR